MLNIKLKKKPIGSVCSRTHCTFFEYVYLNHIYKVFNPLWVSQLKCHIYSKNIVGILRTTESIKSFSIMSISSAVRHQNLYFTFIFVQLQSIISRVFFFFTMANDICYLHVQNWKPISNKHLKMS